jgi:hypothetical protein
MPLSAPRFIGDPVLESCLDGTHRMHSPESGPAVRKVQEGLIDLGWNPGIADSQFGPTTGQAVVAYKTAHGISPYDAVVGAQTMAMLDLECTDKPPAPFSDPEEWRSWRNRAAIPRVGAFDFTRADELARRAAGTPFTFDANSAGWLPPVLQIALTQSFSALLEPSGSPLGAGTPAATWGLGPFDLYHLHLVLWTGGVLPVPPQLMNGPLLSSQVAQLHVAAAAVPGAVPSNAPWTAEFARLLLASGLLPQFGLLASDAITLSTPVQPLLFVWHSFEHPRWRPSGMASASPQRHWQTQVAPLMMPPAPFPFIGNALSTVTQHLFQIAFFVSKTGVITAMPGGGLEAGSMLGLTWDEITAAQN